MTKEPCVWNNRYLQVNEANNICKNN